MTHEWSPKDGDEDRNDSKKPENQKILEKRITELRKLNEQQLFAKIAVLKEKTYRYVTSFITTCSNEDECTFGSDHCDRTNDSCLDNIGSYECLSNTGYRLSYEFEGRGDGDANPDGYCADIDECVEQSDDCDVTNA